MNSDDDDETMMIEPQLLLDEFDEPVEFKYNPDGDSNSASPREANTPNSQNFNNNNNAGNLTNSTQEANGSSNNRSLSLIRKQQLMMSSQQMPKLTPIATSSHHASLNASKS